MNNDPYQHTDPHQFKVTAIEVLEGMQNYHPDPEMSMAEAQDLLCDFLTRIGHSDLTEAYRRTTEVVEDMMSNEQISDTEIEAIAFSIIRDNQELPSKSILKKVKKGLPDVSTKRLESVLGKLADRLKN